MIKRLMNKLSEFEKMLLISIAFTITLVCIRFFITDDPQYFFYPCNLFLATIPLAISRTLKKYKRINVKVSMLLFLWLLFFPNAPYLITDVFHFEQRPPIAFWFDLLIVISGAWNGVTIGITSLMQVERFLSKHIKAKWRQPATVLLILLCSYGIYLGRYKRYNSWSVVTRPGDIAHTIISHIAEPWEHVQAWLFTFLFSALLGIMYFTIKKMQAIIKMEQ